MAAKFSETITNDSGTVQIGATVQVMSGGSLVTTYTDDALTQNASTTRTSDSNGLVEFYVPDGTYSITFGMSGVSKTLQNVELYDLSTLASTTSGAVANKAQAAAIGIAGTASDMGPFTGSTISDNVSAKAGMQALETAVETKANASALGVTASAADMGSFTGTIIPDNQTVKQAIQALETKIMDILSGNAAFTLPDEADGDAIPAPGSKLDYLSGGVRKLA